MCVSVSVRRYYICISCTPICIHSYKHIYTHLCVFSVYVYYIIFTNMCIYIYIYNHNHILYIRVYIYTIHRILLGESCAHGKCWCFCHLQGWRMAFQTATGLVLKWDISSSHNGFCLHVVNYENSLFVYRQTYDQSLDFG